MTVCKKCGGSHIVVNTAGIYCSSCGARDYDTYNVIQQYKDVYKIEKLDTKPYCDDTLMRQEDYTKLAEKINELVDAFYNK